MFKKLQNTDAVYCTRLKKGDPQALGFLYDKYVDKLFLSALRITNNRELAKDAVQEVFIALWDYRHTITDIHYTQSYLTKVLQSILIKKLKKESVIQHCEVEDCYVSPEESIESILILNDADTEKKHRLKHALSSLSNRQKQLLQLHFNEGLSYEQIAEKLSINYQSVNNLAFRTILRLRRLMYIFIYVCLVNMH